MFKKSFAALAVFGFCASYANASSVILYGVVDEALVFTHEKFDVTGEEGTKTNTFGLESGPASVFAASKTSATAFR